MKEQKHLCGKCNGEFFSEEEYLEYVCNESGLKPTERGHHDHYDVEV